MFNGYQNRLSGWFCWEHRIVSEENSEQGAMPALNTVFPTEVTPPCD